MKFRFLGLTLVLIIIEVNGRPKELDDIPKSSSSKLNDDGLAKIEDIAVVARASNDDSSLNPSVAKVTDQLIDTIGQMVEKDIRTPPKLKEKIEASGDAQNATSTASPVVDKVEANGKFQLSTDTSEGKANNIKKDSGTIIKGVAVPVIMDEEPDKPSKKLQKIPNVDKPPKDDGKRKNATTTKPSTTTPSSGLSTWILLSDNREATTPGIPKNKKNASTTTKKPAKAQVTTVKSTTSKPAVKKSTLKPELKRAESVSALEEMVSQKKNSTTRLSQKKKTDANTNKDSDSKKIVTVPPSIVVETTEISTTDAASTEVTVEASTKKKKTATKKRKKNKNRRKKPAEKSGNDQEVKEVLKQPKQPVGAQLYNFLSREIMPTVGLGLVGVLVTAGLAGLLGYNPFAGANLPVRRTYESQHGYSPNGNYYAYNSEYGETDGGQNEEVLFREVLSGMPEDSRYSLPHSEAAYPEAQLYNSQEQAYDAAKTPESQTEKKTDENSNSSYNNSYSPMYGSSYEAYSNKESVSKYPVYSGSSGGSYDYPERSPSATTEKFKASSKYSSSSTIEKQPEALYRVSSDYMTEEESSSGPEADTAWHRIGSPSDPHYAYVEPGPRQLDLEKMTQHLTSAKKRSKRSPEGLMATLVRRSKEIAGMDNDRENEIDFGNELNEKGATNPTTDIETTQSSVDVSEKGSEVDNSIGSGQSTTESSSLDGDSSTSAVDAPPSLMDVMRRLAQFKLRLGINFLKTTAEAFYRYLEGVQKKVEDSMANDTSFSSMRNTWLGRNSGDDVRIREKRFHRKLE